MMSSYEARSVGSDCSFLVDTNELACLRDKQLQPDFLKLSFFSSFGKGGSFRTECIHKMARKCNVWPESVVSQCSADAGEQFRDGFKKIFKKLILFFLRVSYQPFFMDNLIFANGSLRIFIHF